MKKLIFSFLLVGVFASRAAADGSLSIVNAEDPTRLAALQALRAQVDVQRQKEEDLQLLQIEVQRLKLEIEKKKAQAELGRFSGTGDPASAVAETGAMPVLRYVFISGAKKEAWFDVNGIELKVEEGGVAGGYVVRSISSDGVVIVDGNDRDMFMPALRK